MGDAADRFLGINVPGQRIPSLDGLRAISVMLVLWSHLLGTEGFFPRQSGTHYGDLGVLGVRIFFIISGFLITTILLTEWQRTGSVSLKWFYFRRTLRIFPAMYAYVAVVGVSTLLGWVYVPRQEFWYATTYTMNFVADPQWIVGHLWSLSVEEQFYLLWPVTLVLLGPRRALRVAMMVVLVTPLIRFVSMYVPSARPLIGLSFPTIADPLAIGCLLAGMRSRLDGDARYLRFLTSRLFWIVPVSVFLLNAAPGAKLNMLLTQSLMNAGIAICIDRWVRFPSSPSGAFLNYLPLRCIGVLSYSLYLWQQLFVDPTVHGSISHRFPLNVCLAAVAGYASYRLIEKPFLDLRVRLEKRWRRPQPPPGLSVLPEDHKPYTASPLRKAAAGDR
jgi:peptidoglycan/LPS O-acetylase OafA/YrhL